MSKAGPQKICHAHLLPFPQVADLISVGIQVISLILPRRVNVRRKSAWYAKGGEQPDLSPEDAQVKS